MRYRFFTLLPVLAAIGFGAGFISTDRALNLAFKFRNLGSAAIANGPWRTYANLATPELKPFVRAMVARIGMGALTSDEAIYWLVNTDSSGEALSGRNRYEVRFEPGSLNEEGGFWSLSLYGANHYFYENDSGVYSLGERDNLQRNSDGSLSIFVASRGPDTNNNWLPAPDGEAFSLTLRYYIPIQRMVDDPRDVVLPKVKRIGSGGEDR